MADDASEMDWSRPSGFPMAIVGSPIPTVRASGVSWSVNKP